MQKVTTGITLLLVIFLWGCSPSRDKTIDEIKSLEKRLFSPQVTSFDKKKADSLIGLYENFARRFPDDSLAAGYVFKAASIAMNSGDGNKALVLYDQIIEKYPQYKKAPLCVFFKGFVYENLLNDLPKAKEQYTLFISTYPDNEFVPSAQASIQNLGKTPEQLVMEFEAKKKADSTKVADSLASMKKKSGKRK